ncbi:hypothetical protein HK097_009280 [Rhizophlyctis rosea]|uniref:BZIP domain-containing protein n=1 Tax=Rhizophlyctis rosea TaxID=64517 RepID=A0AAD5SKE8_9FUNG|nr:hypothetical protein HK097_009280 [Rhizophlyctis rosea]
MSTFNNNNRPIAPAAGPPRKKPGAKPNPFITDMAAHRREKNRQAQKALRDRRSAQSIAHQQEVAELNTQITVLQEKNEKLKNLLAMAFSVVGAPEITQKLDNSTVDEAMLIAANALTSLHTAMDLIHHTPDTPAQTPPQPCIPPPPPQQQPSQGCCGSLSNTCRPTPLEVEQCANTIPCFVLRDKILEYGPKMDLGKLCDELVAHAVCHGDPWNPEDWSLPADFFDRFPLMR